METITESRPSFLVRSLLPIVYNCGVFVVGLVSIAVGLLYTKQDKLLYFPEIGARKNAANPRGYRSPGEHKIPFETHMIPTSDGLSIHSWLLIHPRSISDGNNNKKPTVIFFHGNAGNVGGRLHNGIQMFQLLQVNVLMVEYRGYGDSDDAVPSEKGLKLDGEAALRFASDHPSMDSSQLYIFGRSLGGAVAFHVANYAAQNGILLAGLIVENTFSSISDMVDVIMPLVAPLKGLVLRIGWNSGDIVSKIHIPILYMAGGADELVPHSHMRNLFDKSCKKGASVCARMHVIKNGTHNESWHEGGNLYWEKFRSFLNESKRLMRQSSSFSSFDASPINGSDDIIGDDNTESVAVGMGVEVELPSNSNHVNSAIPIMPGNFMGMAREVGKKKKL